MPHQMSIGYSPRLRAVDQCAVEPAVAWKIVIERGNLGFSAAHFITLEGAIEPLHGHNYGVRVEVAGDLTPDAIVLDFVRFKAIMRGLCKEWDHRFLMPLANPLLDVRELPEDAWEIRAPGGVRYVMPRSSVVPLPVDNVTTERLAERLARRVVETLGERDLAHGLRRVEVGIAETEMQTAFFTVELTPGAIASPPPGAIASPP